MLVADEQHPHLRRHIAVEAVVEDHLVGDFSSGDKLAHQPIIVNPDVVYQAVDLLVHLRGMRTAKYGDYPGLSPGSRPHPVVLERSNRPISSTVM